MPVTQNNLIDSIRDAAHPLWGTAEDFDVLLNAIGDARFVLLGEATHGTHEFYSTRAQITRRLIAEKGFAAVVVEGDWPDAYRVNRFVRGFHDDEDAEQALSGFKRFPQWMWRNADVLDFVNWLRAHNDLQGEGEAKAGFYGMDLYSLYSSIEAVLEYLDKVDHAAATRARYRYSCFEHFRENPQAYGYAAGFDLDRSCEEQAIQQLIELRKRAADYARRDGRIAQDEHFYAEQNARLVKNDEEYYRTMFGGRVSSWNLRDQHMVATIRALADHLDRTGQSPTKLVIWAHNSHLGDARATEMGRAGELNVGQLIRQIYRQSAFLVGFTTHTGTVTAATEWDGPAENKRVVPSLPDSYERLFHETQLPQFLLTLRDAGQMRSLLADEHLERAIGVIYRPETERLSHYFTTRLSEQFDAVIHFDRTRAVEPLERTPQWEEEEVPEAYPSGL